ncbi:carbohydrate binding domain-containing protein [Streptomyces bullii]|uniref:Carbohydrate binding domain-containing protein n=1 Tax=Streptomyces bullii TaxID=349910 RepID=A0ABW0UQJ9_9ACTN
MPVRISAEVAFGYTITSASPVWTDITRYVEQPEGISITRGTQNELSETQPGTMTLTLDNSDGRFTADRTASPYHPNVKRHVPIRVRTITADKNLITNPSFESGLTDWSPSATPTIAQDATHVKHGSQAMLMTFGGGIAGQNAWTTLYGLDIGQTYTASAYVWVPTGDTHVHFLLDGGPQGAASTVNDAWQRITLTFTATAPQHVLRVRSNTTPAAGDQVWIDAVMVEEGSAASALNHVVNSTFETGTSGWALGSDASTSLAQSSTRAWQGAYSLLATWGGAFNSNPTFETALSPWTGAGGATVTRVITVAQSGSWSAQITPDGVTASPRMQSEEMTVTAGVSYRAHGYLRCTAARTVGLNVNWYDAAHAYISTSSNSAAVTANTWTLFNASFTAPTGAVYARLVPTISGTPPTSDVLYVDEVRLLASNGSPAPAVGATITGLTAGTTYTASAYVWVPSGAPAVQLSVTGIGTGGASTLTGQWQHITCTFTATGGSHTVQIIPAGYPQYGHQVWVDTVQVEEGSNASAFGALDGAQIHGRFVGMVNEWPVEWQGQLSKAVITCTDIFKWAGLNGELLPMLNQEILLDKPTAYYPLSEPSESTTAGDISGTAEVGSLSIVQAGTGGTLTFGEGTVPADGLGCPVFTPASASAGKYLQADLGQTFQDANVNFRLRIECWFSTSTSGRVLLALASPDLSNKLVISLESGTGKLMIEFAQDGMALQSYVAATPNLADGNRHYIVFNEFADELFVDGTTYSTVTTSAADFRQLYVGGFQNSRLWNGQIAQLAIYVRSVTISDISPHYTTGTTEHIGESASARASRIASYVGLTVTAQGTVFDGVASQKALGRSALEHLREIETTESGKLLASRSTTALILQSRDLRYNPIPAVSLRYVDLDTDTVKLSNDDQKMINTVAASRPGGATQRIVNQTSVDTYGPKPQTLELFKTTDLKVTDAANWLVSRYGDPPSEIRQVPMDAYSLPLVTYRALLDADVSTTLELAALPAEAPSSTATVTIEGYTETIGQGRHYLDFHTSRAQTDTVWVLDDSRYSVLDSTTRLAY